LARSASRIALIAAGAGLGQLFEYLLAEAPIQRKFLRAMRAGDRRVAMQP
jgi:hypothetical protein